MLPRVTPSCPASYRRLYRTGDAGVWRDGVMMVAGRLDRQIKVRGVRIQPEEIEARLKRFRTTPPASRLDYAQFLVMGCF